LAICDVYVLSITLVITQEAASAVVEAYNFLPNLVCDLMHDTTYIFLFKSFIELWICGEISTNFAQ
jgi:hypothetical protein